MNIFDFERSVNSKILDRGYNYYLSEYVNDDFEKDKDTYTFSVDGSDTYEVVVELDKDNNILNSECDCPYDYGPICKHEVAVFYKLREILDMQDSKDDISKSKDEKRKQVTLPQVLEGLNKSQLIKIIIEEVEENTALKEKILLKYSPVYDYKEEFAKCRKYIYSKFKEYLSFTNYSYYNYVAYEKKINLFAQSMYDMLSRAENYHDKILGVDVAFEILAQIISSDIEYRDEDYQIEELLSDIVVTMECIATSAEGSENRKVMFEHLLKKCNSVDLDGWYNYQMDLINICCQLADDLQDKIFIKMKIEAMIEMEPENYNSMYSKETLKKYLYDFIVEYLDEEEGKEFMNENIDYSTFREMAIKDCFKKGNYEKVIEYTENVENSNLDEIYIRYDKLKWKKYRYIAYQKLGLIEEQKVLAKELLFEGYMDYYKELKSLSKDENFYENFKNDMEKLKNYNKGIYLEIIKKEKDLDSIMEYVRLNHYSIEEYAKILKPKYKDEIKEIYENCLKKQAEHTCNRSQYKSLCGKIKKYKSVLGKRNADELIEELKITYKRRRAMIEELSKIK